MCETVTVKSVMIGQHLNEFIEMKGVELPNRVNEGLLDVLEICMEIDVE